jgi:citronellol/citronellal dehydrogenase
MHFKNKTVFITGGSRGIGLEIAKKLASEGANIVIAAKTSEPHPKLPGTIHTAAAEIEAAGGKALACMVDIRDENQVLAAVQLAVDTFGGIDILINNASAIQLTGTLSTEMKKYDLMNQVNTRGTYLCAQACLPHLLKSENPHVLTLSPPLKITWLIRLRNLGCHFAHWEWHQSLREKWRLIHFGLKRLLPQLRSNLP